MTALVRLIAVTLAALALSGSAAAARVPAAVSSIQIRSATGVTASVTRPAAVRRIVEWLDALPRFAVRPCPLELHYPPNVSFTFRDAGGSVLLRAVDHVPGTCPSSVTFTTGGPVRHATLADDGFVAKVSQLLGTDFGANAKTAAHERAAKRDAARILRLAILPAGSRRLAKSPDKALGHASPDWTSALVDIHRFWKVHRAFASVAAFERKHVPRGAKLELPTCACGLTFGTEDTFSFPALHGRLSSRQLDVEVAPLRHGWTGIRVDAEDVWVVARDAYEKVPAGVRTIVLRRSDQASAHRITGRADVARVVRWFDALRVVQPVTYHCPALRGRRVTLSFRNAHGIELARASGLQIRGVYGPCVPVAFRIGGVGQKPLVPGHFFGRVELLAG